MKNGKKRPNSTSFSKQNQPPPESKRVKKGKTILKESIGLESWAGIAKYIEENGATKFINELNALDGKSFSFLFLQAAEFFKPKLSRAETQISGGVTLTIKRKTV